MMRGDGDSVGVCDGAALGRSVGAVEVGDWVGAVVGGSVEVG